MKAILEVDNIPYFAKDLSLGDKILADFNHGIPMFEAVVERGGHSTYRIFVENATIKASNTLDTLKAMGCGWEAIEINGGKLYALDIPPEADIYDVYDILERGQREGTWSCEQGHLGHPLKEDPASNPS